MEMAGGYETRDRPRRDPRGAGMALINTADQGQGRGGRQVAADAATAQDGEPAGDAGIKEEERKRTAASPMKEESLLTSTTTGRRAAGTAAATSTGSTSARS